MSITWHNEGCKTCNIAKNTSNLQEFKDWIIKIYDKTIKGDINE